MKWRVCKEYTNCHSLSNPYFHSHANVTTHCFTYSMHECFIKRMIFWDVEYMHTSNYISPNSVEMHEQAAHICTLSDALSPARMQYWHWRNSKQLLNPSKCWLRLRLDGGSEEETRDVEMCGWEGKGFKDARERGAGIKVWDFPWKCSRLPGSSFSTHTQKKKKASPLLHCDCLRKLHPDIGCIPTVKILLHVVLVKPDKQMQWWDTRGVVVCRQWHSLWFCIYYPESVSNKPCADFQC